jgi:hypothetical protein
MDATCPEPCKTCGALPLLLAWQYFRNGTRHIRGDCPACRRFSHYVTQTPAATRGADARPPSNQPPADQ